MIFTELNTDLNRLDVGSYVIDGTSVANINTIATTDIGLKISGQYGQTGDLQQWVDGTGAVRLKVDANGNLSTVGVTTINAYLFGGTLIGNASTATKLAAPTTINGLSFDGSAPITITSVSGNAGTATKLATPRNINGVAFDGSAAITIPTGSATPLSLGTYLAYNSGTTYDTTTPRTLNVNAASANTPSYLVARDASGNFNAGTITAALAGNASTASTLATPRTINGISFDGSTNISILNISGNAGTATKLATPTTINGLNFDGSTPITITSVSGNAGTATKLATPRAINGVNFDGSADITITAASSGLASPLTVGTYLSFAAGSSYDGTASRQITTNATPTNTASTLMARDASGNFAANIATLASASFTNVTGDKLFLYNSTDVYGIGLQSYNVVNFAPVNASTKWTWGTGTTSSSITLKMTLDNNGLLAPVSIGPTAQASALSMNNNKITSVTDPTSAQDAATKNYTDTTFVKAGNYSPGLYALPPAATAGTATALTANSIYGVRFWTAHAFTATKFSFNITANSTAWTSGTQPYVTVGIFSNDGTTQLATASYVVYAAGTGVKTVTISSSALSAGASYWAVIWYFVGGGSGAPTISTVNTPTDLFLNSTSTATKMSTGLGFTWAGQILGYSTNLTTMTGGTLTMATSALPYIGLTA